MAHRVRRDHHPEREAGARVTVAELIENPDHGDHGFFTVRLRPEYRGRPPKDTARSIDGKTHHFRYGWTMDDDDTYPGEVAWIADRLGWPEDAPGWIAGGDLEAPATDAA